MHSSLIPRHRPLGLLAAMVSLCKVLECTVETCIRILFDTGCTLTVYREYHEHDNDDDDDDDNVIIHGILIFKPGRKVLCLVD